MLWSRQRSSIKAYRRGGSFLLNFVPCSFVNSPIGRLRQQNRVSSEHSEAGRAQSPLQPSREGLYDYRYGNG